MTGPGDEMATAEGRGDLRASRADREQVVELLKAAFVQGMLAKDEFDQRVGQAFAARTYAELAAVTADLPANLTAVQPPKPARAQGERPIARPGPVIMVATVLYAGVWPLALLVPLPRGIDGDSAAAASLVLIASLVYFLVLITAVGFAIADRREKRSGGQPPRRPARSAGGQAPRPLSADLGGRPPPVDRGHQDTTEAERSRPRSGSRPPHRWRYRGHGCTIGYVGD